MTIEPKLMFTINILEIEIKSKQAKLRLTAEFWAQL